MNSSPAIIENIKQITIDTVLKIDSLPIILPDKGIIAGRTDLRSYNKQETIASYGRELFYGTDNIHFSMDLAYMDLGIPEVIRKADLASGKSNNEVQRAYAAGIKETYIAISRHINHHATSAAMRGLMGDKRIEENCLHITSRKPATFEEAVQLFWFVWTIRSELSHIHLRNPGFYMATLGRWDQHFYPFLKNDLEKGYTTRESANSLVEELFRKMNMIGVGDTLKNIMLGGSDPNGSDQSNELSLICMDVIINNGFAEPHLNVRFHSSMNDDFRRKAIQLNLMGQGQGEIFNDSEIINQLIRHGIPKDAACNYACDGCEEIIIDREGAILFKELEAMKTLELSYFNGQENPKQANNNVRRWSKDIDAREIHTALTTGFESGDMRHATSFQQVYDIFMKQFRFQVGQLIHFMKENIHFYQQSCISSMVLAGGYLECIETGADPLRDVIKYPLFQLQSGSITPVADALAAIKKVVFEDQFATMEELITALERNFEGDAVLQQKLLSAPKFGNDIDYVDSIAVKITDTFCNWILEENRTLDAYLWPSIYSIFFMDQAALTGATSDGRKCGDPLAVHVSPVPGRALEGPTAILQSAAKIHLSEALAGSPVFLTISRNMIPRTDEGASIVEALIDASASLNIPILSIAVNDVDAMRDACRNPHLYQDLIVRVWGFNARFIDLTPEMQKHIIQRTISN